MLRFKLDWLYRNVLDFFEDGRHEIYTVINHIHGLEPDIIVDDIEECLRILCAEGVLFETTHMGFRSYRKVNKKYNICKKEKELKSFIDQRRKSRDSFKKRAGYCRICAEPLYYDSSHMWKKVGEKNTIRQGRVFKVDVFECKRHSKRT